jgi:GT2 family glycosyltransferase
LAERALAERRADRSVKGETGATPLVRDESQAALQEARWREILLEQRLAQLEAELAAIYGSRAWRLIAPVRKTIRKAMRFGYHPRRRSAARGAAAELATAKRVCLARAEAELEALLAGSERLVVPSSAQPRVSILLVLFNQAALTLACLRSICTTVRMPAEVVIVDNGSSDHSAALLDRVSGARIVRNADNRHFLSGVNQAADLARGEALLLLNSDACLRGGALEAAWRTLVDNQDASAVGGPIVLPDGALQEAGSIIWGDGNCSGYGRGCDPEAPEFQFVREVDYCSAAFLLVRRADFARLGGFDATFAPAYYEDSDFCMRLRAAGRRVLYEPRAAIDHYEFGSAATPDQALALQQRNRNLFAARHAAALREAHHPPATDPLLARMRGQFAGRVLVIEDRVPFASLGAGYPRSSRLLHELHRQDWFVTLYPLVSPEDRWSDIRAAFPPAMEVALGLGEAGLAQFLRARDGYYDAILVSRPHNMQRFLAARGETHRGARLIYDAEAIFAARESARMALAGERVSMLRRQAMIQAEMKLAHAAQTVVTVSPRDAEQLRNSGCADVQVLGHALLAEPTPKGFDARTDLLFVGALDDDPSPNTDGLLWFVAKVMPILDELIGDAYRLVVAGRCGAKRVAALAGPRIRLLGRVPDLSPLYARARLFLAPARYAAGIPHKVHEAAAHGVPVVATPLLAQQLDWRDGRELLVGGSPHDFAAACARAWSDPDSWRQLRENALARVAEDCDPAGFARAVAQLMAFRGPLPAAAVAPGRKAPAGPQAMALRTARVARSVGSALRYWRRNGWAATRERLEGELLRRSGRLDYATWIRIYDTLRDADRQAIGAHLANLADRPRFSLVLPRAAGDRAALQRTLDSVLEQIYPEWELLAHRPEDAELGATLDAYAAREPRISAALATSAGADDIASSILTESTGRFVVTVSPGEALRPHTLYMLAVECNAYPDALMLYGDHDIRDEAGVRRDPNFKPDWSAELALDPESMGAIAAISRDIAIAAAEPLASRQDFTPYGLLLGASDRLEPALVRHIPHILSHLSAAAPPAAGAGLEQTLASHLRRIGEPAEIRQSHGRLRIHWEIADPPLVSLIVPTRDNATLLRGFLAGLLGRTAYPRLEVILVDNDSLDPIAQRVLREAAADPRVSILPYSQPFNYSAMNNLAVERSRGEVIALLNNDLAVRDPHWLSEMVSCALRPGVGAVGAKLYYPNGTIQHAGVVTGMCGIAGHPLRGTDGNLDGPHGLLRRVRTVGAVTAACMVLRRARYEEAGGLDEINLPISYSDVDLCMRLRARGYRIVWTPFAELTHLESASRGQDTDPANRARAEQEFDYMRRKWDPARNADPCYSPNLSLAAEDCALAFPPRIGWPWRALPGSRQSGE